MCLVKRIRSYLVLAELGEGALNALTLSPWYEHLLVWYYDSNYISL